MKLLNEIPTAFIAARTVHPMLGWGDNQHGWFVLHGFELVQYHPVNASIIASAGMGWDHVSIVISGRLPTWDEMEALKRAFFYPHECAMQLHPPESDYVNTHPFCLHLWRPQVQPIQMPPIGLV